MATKLVSQEISDLDPYKFMAVIGKRVIHPGGRASTKALLSGAQITASDRVLDVGCGVATTAIEIARRHRAQVTAVMATEFYWRRAPTLEAKEIFLGQVCPGMHFDTVEDWKRIYSTAGLTGLDTQTGPFERMTARGFRADKGMARCLAIMGRVAGRPAYTCKMAWLMPRMARAVPYLGYIVIAGTKPA